MNSHKNKKKNINFLFLLLLLVFLTGCNPTVKTNINFQENGEGDMSISLSIPNNVFKEDIANETSLNNTGLFTKSDLKENLKKRFVGFNISENTDDKYTNYKIYANYKNKQVKSFIDKNFSISNSGIGHKYSIAIPLKDFVPTLNNQENKDINENSDNFLEANYNTLMSSNLFDFSSFLSKKAKISLNITVPGEIDDYNFNEYATVNKNTITYNLSDYISDAASNNNMDSTIIIKSKKIGGNLFKNVSLVAVFILFVIISNLIKKINKGPFSDD